MDVFCTSVPVTYSFSNTLYVYISRHTCMCDLFCSRPVDVKNKVKGISRTTARFPIRSGPKQFAAYLNGEYSCLIS